MEAFDNDIKVEDNKALFGKSKSKMTLTQTIIVTVTLSWLCQPLRVMVKADRGPLNLLMVGNGFSETHNVEELIEAMLSDSSCRLYLCSSL
jgi:hypothetical protein